MKQFGRNPKSSGQKRLFRNMNNHQKDKQKQTQKQRHSFPTWIHFLILSSFLMVMQILWFYRHILHHISNDNSSSTSNIELQSHLPFPPRLPLSKSSASQSHLYKSTTTNRLNQPKKQKRKQNKRKRPSPDGYLHNHPLFYQEIPTSSSSTNHNAHWDGDNKTSSTLWSQMHCIGETNSDPFFHRRTRTHFDKNWMTRSCHFQFLCWNMTSREFLLYLPNNNTNNFDNDDKENNNNNNNNKNDVRQHHSHESQQTVFTNRSVDGYPFAISLGGINTKWTHTGYVRLKWFPRVIHDSPTSGSGKNKTDGSTPLSSSSSTPTSFGFYTLPSNVVWMPFHSLAAFNPGHLVWDDFLPLFTLLQIFFTNDSFERDNGNENDNDDDEEKENHVSISEETSIVPFPIRYELPGEGLWASCDWRNDRHDECAFMLRKFGPLFVKQSQNIKTAASTTAAAAAASKDDTIIPTQLSMKANFHTPKKSDLICARHGVAGIGALTDHGTDKGHGWEERDYEQVYNGGRGGQLWRFRNFMMTNMGIPIHTAPPPGPPFRILFSEASSKGGNRNIKFDNYVKAIEKTPDLSRLVELRQVKMKDHTLREQIEMTMDAAMYVTACGGGAMTATFLPRGASLVIFYSEVGGIENNANTGKPARLDWDYFNNMAYTRVHWMTQPKHSTYRSTQSIDSTEMDIFVNLVRHEVEVMRLQREAYDE